MDFNDSRFVAGSVQGTIDHHNPCQAYGNDDWATVQTHNEGWDIRSYPIPGGQAIAHNRSVSDDSYLNAPEQPNPTARRRSVPTIYYTFPQIHQSQQALGYNTDPLLVPRHSRDHQYAEQPLNPDLFTACPHLSLTIPPTVYAPTLDSHYSPTQMQWPTSQTSPQTSQRLNTGFQSGTLIPQNLSQDASRGIMDRTARSNARIRPYPQHATRQTSPTWESGPGSGSPENLSPTASGSQMAFNGSDFSASPGAGSDTYHSFVDTPASTNGLILEESEEKADSKLKQRERKRQERAREAEQLTRVKQALGSDKMTKVDTLEKAIALLDGNVPVRRNEPTQALKDRSERATQVAASRKDITRLFEEIGRLVGYTPQTAPRRELLLEAVAIQLELKMVTETRFLASQEGAGPYEHKFVS